MNDRAIAAALGALAGYALARHKSASEASSGSSSAPFLYAPPPSTIAALAELADVVYPSAAPALRAAAKGAAMLQPQAQAWLVQEGDRLRAYACPPPPGSRIIRTARGENIAAAIQNLQK